jgi:hypothetical protein
LPSYIEWKNVKQPAAEELVFNPTSRELVWRLGRVVAGGAPRTVSFQVGLVPTLNQVGLAPDLTGRVKLSAFDTFAETVVEGDIREISTKDLSDTGYRSEMGVVVR